MTNSHGSTTPDLAALWSEVVVVPDFPTPGISFKDLSGILANPATLRIAVNAWAHTPFAKNLRP